MVPRALMAVWGVLDFFLLAAGGLSIALSIVWKQPNPLINLVVSEIDLTVGLILGILLLLTFVFSIGAIVQKNHITIGLVILNWILIVDALGVLVIGTFIWVFTLKEQENYHAKFIAAPQAAMIAVQDKLQCCGYFNTSDAVIVGGFCQSADFAVTHNTTCVGPITNFADMTLENTFSTVYGFMAIIIAFFLASLCVIKQRELVERFKRIDSKRGGRGFV